MPSEASGHGESCSLVVRFSHAEEKVTQVEEEYRKRCESQEKHSHVLLLSNGSWSAD